MLITQIVNWLTCGVASLFGMGSAFCAYRFKDTDTVILLPWSYKFADDFEFTKANFNLLVQKGIARIVQNIDTTTNSTPANDRRTFEQTGRMTTSLKHPYLWDFVLDPGIKIYKALLRLDGTRKFTMISFDSEGNCLLAKDKSGKVRGLKVLMNDTGPYVFGNENSFTWTVQVDRNDLDNNVAVIASENVPFDASMDLDDYNDVFISLVAPANAATALKFSIHVGDGTDTGAEKKVPLEGLAVGNLLLKKTVGSTVTVITPTDLDPDPAGDPGDYILTTATGATGNTLSLQLYDAAVPSDIADIEDAGGLFKSNVATTVVGA